MFSVRCMTCNYSTQENVTTSHIYLDSCVMSVGRSIQAWIKTLNFTRNVPSKYSQHTQQGFCDHHCTSPPKKYQGIGKAPRLRLAQHLVHPLGSCPLPHPPKIHTLDLVNIMNSKAPVRCVCTRYTSYSNASLVQINFKILKS